MRDVQMKKSDLLHNLNENMLTHREEFEEALTGWKKKVTEVLAQKYQEALDGKRFEEYISIPRPQDHTEDYEQAIEMLGFEQRDVLTLTAQEYAQFVMDNWGWKGQFTTTNAAYVSPQN